MKEVPYLVRKLYAVNSTSGGFASMLKWSITWWEYEEWLEHVISRPDIWLRDGFNWTRMETREGGIALLVNVIPPLGTSKFRMAHFTLEPVHWDVEECVDYFRNMLDKWTTYGDRISLQSTYETELGLDPQKAMVAAIVASHIFIVGSLKDDFLARGDFHEDREDYPHLPSMVLGQWELLRGGCVRLYTAGKHTVRALLLIGNGPGSEGPLVELRGHLHPSEALAGMASKWFGELGNPYDVDESGSGRANVQAPGADQRETE